MRCCSLLLLQLAGIPHVRLDVEVGEQADQDDQIDCVQGVDGFVGGAGRLQGGIDVHQHRDQLGQLDDGDDRLDAAGERLAGLERRQEVVRVHDHVHDRVQHHDGHLLVGCSGGEKMSF